MNITSFVNISEVDDSYENHPENYLEFDPSNDYFIFSAGSVSVADGEPIPTSEQLNEAMTQLPEAGEEVIVKIFVADVSEDIIREIHLAGQQNKRYVFCVSADAATATEPVLQLWDNNLKNTFNYYVLGEGTETDSKVHGVVTTSGLPGVAWEGIKLAGSDASHVLYLNDESGKLTEAKDLYFNVYCKVSSDFEAALENPIFYTKCYQIAE